MIEQPYPEMVERAARAIYETHWVEGAPVWENASRKVREWVRAQARNVFPAIREPTEAMKIAGNEHHSGASVPLYRSYSTIRLWRAMCDAATLPPPATVAGPEDAGEDDR